MSEPIWITGVGLVSCLGEGAGPHLAALARPLARPLADPAAPPVVDAATFAPFPIHPLPSLNLDKQIPKKGDQRQMEPWQRLGTYAAGLAIDHAGARGLVADMHLVVAAGGGERDVPLDEAICKELAGLPAGDAGPLLNERLANGLRPTLFLAQLSNLLAGNISIVHGVTGSSRTFMGEESAAADAVRIAAARLAEGRGEMALVGGAYVAGRWDMMLLYAPSGGLWRGEWAPLAERGAAGGGMVTGSAAAFLVLETASHARARGAKGLAVLQTTRSGAARRRDGDTAEASAATLAQGLPLRPGYAVFSGASGVAAATGSEARFQAALPEPASIRHTTDLLGHTVEAAFPANIALAALAIEAGLVPQALVTGFGMWRGEALAVLEPIAEGAAA